jgi:hypothetical protein
MIFKCHCDTVVKTCSQLVPPIPKGTQSLYTVTFFYAPFSVQGLDNFFNLVGSIAVGQ